MVHELAKQTKGVLIVRPYAEKRALHALFLVQAPAYMCGMLNVSELARVCGLSRTTAYKYLGLLEG